MEVVARGFFNGDGPPSNRVAFSIDAAAAPLPPTDVVAMASDTTVAMSWLAAETGEAPGSYIIEAAPAGSTTFATAAVAQQPSFFAMRLPAGDWQVRIRAMNSAGTSGPSNVVALRTARCTSAPASPQQLTVTPIGAIPSLRWIPPSSGPAESYILEVGTTSGSSNLGRFSVTGAATAYEVSAPVGVYYVRVRASNGCGNSALSNEVIAVSGAMP
jgi:predicted phage tail protein